MASKYLCQIANSTLILSPFLFPIPLGHLLLALNEKKLARSDFTNKKAYLTSCRFLIGLIRTTLSIQVQFANGATGGPNRLKRLHTKEKLLQLEYIQWSGPSG